MAKFNTGAVKTARTQKSYIKDATGTSTVTTHQGGTGAVLRDEKSELFLLVVSSFMEDTFYESRTNAEARLRRLVGQVAVQDVEWIKGLIPWLRNEANLRSISIATSLEAAKALVDSGIPGGRQLVDSAMSRADEPGEAVAYWLANHGRAMPKAVKRGIADAATRLYNEFSFGKYDRSGSAVRFGDVIALTHPTPRDEAQYALFGYARAVQKDTTTEVPEVLTQIANRKAARSAEDVRAILDQGPEALRSAGLTWENVSSAIGGMGAKEWEAVIPTMGYMALLRNLRNFAQAGISVKARKEVAARLSDAEQVAKSRQLPFRFLSAMTATEGIQDYATALSDALDLSLGAVPSLKGRTLILVDCSASMGYGLSSRGYGRSTTSRMTNAAIFGSALALAAENATLVAFGTGSEVVPFRKGGSVISLAEKFESMGGTDTAGALRSHFAGHDRVVILTDEQFGDGYYSYGRTSNPADVLSADVPLYTWNLAGYASGHGSGANRYTFGGLTDASFKTISLLEAGKNGTYPWETK